MPTQRQLNHQLERAQRNNQRMNGLYWNNDVLRVMFQYLGVEGFPGLEPGLTKLGKSANLYESLLHVHSEGITVTGPKVPKHPQMGERYQLCFPAIGAWEFGRNGAWKTIYHDWLDVENPPHEFNMQMWQRDTHMLANPRDTSYRGDMYHARPTRGIFVVDVEYKNKDFDHEFLVNQEHVFGTVNGVVRSIEKVMHKYGFQYLKVMTGKGYNLVAHVPEFDPMFEEARKIGGPLESSLLFYMGQTEGKRIHQVSVAAEQVHKGLNRLMQFITLEGIKQYRRDDGHARITTKTSGDGPQVIIDQYCMAVEAGMKGTGIPGNVYLKPWFQDWKKGFRDFAREVLPYSCMPIRLPLGYNGGGHRIGEYELSLPRALAVRNNVHLAMEFLSGARGSIPNCSDGIRNVLHDYFLSPIGNLHRQMDREPEKNLDIRFETGKLEREGLPKLAAMLWRADPELNMSSGLNALIPTLYHRGWQPKAIANLIASGFALQKDKKWTQYYSIHRRANGETERVIGEIVTGLR